MGSINTSAEGVNIRTVLELSKDGAGRLKISSLLCNASIARMHAGFSGTLRYRHPSPAEALPPSFGLLARAASFLPPQKGVSVPGHLHHHGNALPPQPAGEAPSSSGRGSNLGEWGGHPFQLPCRNACPLAAADLKVSACLERLLSAAQPGPQPLSPTPFLALARLGPQKGMWLLTCRGSEQAQEAPSGTAWSGLAIGHIAGSI